MKSPLQHVLIMAGGTGGHVFPGLAVAAYLRQQGIQVSWLGTPQGLEARLVPEADIPFYTIQVTGLRGKGIKTLFAAPFMVLSAIMQAKGVIRQIKPDVVLGMGGFASGPGGIASWLSGKPLVIHEQNAKAGLTNKVLSRLAKRNLSGFPDVFPNNRKTITVGNPVRSVIEASPSPRQRARAHDKSLHLLVLGGSLGAQALNQLVPATLAKLPEPLRPEIMHQTGNRHVDQVKNDYESRGLKANIIPFIEDMAQAYQWADLVLCRAGALTVAELCSAGVGAILVPFPHAVDDHQTANAAFMEKAGAAICIQQADLNESRLAEMLLDLSSSPQRLVMAQSAYNLRKEHVPEQIFDILSKVVTKQEIET